MITGPYFVDRASDTGSFVIKPIPGPIIAEIEPLPDAAEHARLLAASWEMYRALKDIDAARSGRPKSCGHDFECICTMDAARAALAKAEAVRP